MTSAAELKRAVCAVIDDRRAGLIEISRGIHAEPELAFHEVKAAARLTAAVERHGQFRSPQYAGRSLYPGRLARCALLRLDLSGRIPANLQGPIGWPDDNALRNHGLWGGQTDCPAATLLVWDRALPRLRNRSLASRQQRDGRDQEITFASVANRLGETRPASFLIGLGTAVIRKRNPSPEFDVSIAQFVGALARFLIVVAVKLHRARHVAVFVQNISSVARHWLSPVS